MAASVISRETQQNLPKRILDCFQMLQMIYFEKLREKANWKEKLEIVVSWTGIQKYRLYQGEDGNICSYYSA